MKRSQKILHTTIKEGTLLNREPLVSIIVPVYNAQAHIARCIESIRKQTYQNIEIILLNDGSRVSCWWIKRTAGCRPRAIWG